MVYRKTPAGRARDRAKADAIIEATIDVIAKSGADGLTTDAVAKRAGIPAGSLYQYFADKTEIMAAATAHILARDVALMRESETSMPGPIDLVSAIMALFMSFEWPRVVRFMFDSHVYRDGIRDELGALIKRAVPLPPREREIAASVILGIMDAIYRKCGAGERPAAIAVVYSLRSLSIPNAAINRAIDRSLSHG